MSNWFISDGLTCTGDFGMVQFDVGDLITESNFSFFMSRGIMRFMLCGVLKSGSFRGVRVMCKETRISRFDLRCE